MAYIFCGGRVESNRKLYVVPHRNAFAFWFWDMDSELQVMMLVFWVVDQAALLYPALF